MLSILLSTAMLYFFIISLINVILSSIKSICTVRYGRGINVITNVVSYSFYTIVVKQTANLPLEITVLSTAITNALGVWLSYIILDKIHKDRLWKIEVIVSKSVVDELNTKLDHILHNYIETGPKVLFNFYCRTKAESREVVAICKQYDGKVFAVENKFKGFDGNY